MLKRASHSLATLCGLLAVGLNTAAEAATYQFRQPSPGVQAAAGQLPAAPVNLDCSLPATLGGGNLANGQTYSGMTLYSTTTVDAPGTCASVVVTESCANGMLSVANPATSCTVADPSYGAVVLLMHMEDATDATNRHTLTSGGSPTPITTVKQMGTASMAFNGTSRLSSANSADFQFGTGDFTVEFWLNSPVAWTAQPASAGIIGQKKSDSTDGWVIYRDGNYPSKLNARVTSSLGYCTTASTPSQNTWEHWALVRQGTTVRWFKNGVVDATCAISASANVNDTTGTFYLGFSQTWSGYLQAYLDDVRVTKGVARYTAGFSVPTAPFPNQ